MNQEINAYVGSRIRSIRRSKNMSIQQLADAISKSKACVSKYEKGEISKAKFNSNIKFYDVMSDHEKTLAKKEDGKTETIYPLSAPYDSLSDFIYGTGAGFCCLQ